MLPSPLSARPLPTVSPTPSCFAPLQAEGDYVAEGTIIAAVFGALAILIIIAAVLFYLKRRSPPPPPPGGIKGAAPAY